MATKPTDVIRRPVWARLTHVLVLLVVLATAACSMRREPIYVSSEFGRYDVRSVHLLPVVDVRPDPFREVQIVSQVRRASTAALVGKGYRVVTEAISREGRTLTAANLGRMSDRELAEVAPPESPHLVIVYVERVEARIEELGQTTRVKLASRLLDVASQTTLWRDSAEGEADLGGLLTVLSGPATEYEAAYDAARLLFSTLPDAPAGRGDQTPSPGSDDGEHAPLGPTRPTR